MTDDELKAIKARANAATPGPWRLTEMQKLRLEHKLAYENKDGYYDQPAADIAFANAAREDVYALIAEVERLRALMAAPPASPTPRSASAESPDPA